MSIMNCKEVGDDVSWYMLTVFVCSVYKMYEFDNTYL